MKQKKIRKRLIFSFLRIVLGDPFGDYKKPAKGKPVKIVENYFESVAYRIYQRAGLPDISINCIVGMNGAGKSTLLDILSLLSTKNR